MLFNCSRLRLDEEPLGVPTGLDYPVRAPAEAGPGLSWILRIAVLGSRLFSIHLAAAEELRDAEAGRSGQVFHLRAHLVPFGDALLIDCGLNFPVQGIEVLQRHFLKLRLSHLATLLLPFCCHLKGPSMP